MAGLMAAKANQLLPQTNDLRIETVRLRESRAAPLETGQLLAAPRLRRLTPLDRVGPPLAERHPQLLVARFVARPPEFDLPCPGTPRHLDALARRKPDLAAIDRQHGPLALIQRPVDDQRHPAPPVPPAYGQ